VISFNDAALDDPEALASADPWIRPLAEAGARLRRDADRALEELADVSSDGFRPRAVVAIGPEARLLRAVLELSCPVPFVAWSHHGLPAWVGPLDVVVVLGGPGSLGSASEALRRGCRLIVVAQPDSDLAMQTASRSTTLLPAATGDPLDGAVVALLALRRFGLAPEVDPHAMADAMDAVAEACSHSRDLSHNPAKALAIELADSEPLVWGGTVLASRASRRIVEAVRAASGRVALAADASDLAPILLAAEPPDPFEDPFESGCAPQRLSLLIVSDGMEDAATRESRTTLEANAAFAGVRVSTLEHRSGEALERYVTVLQRGRFAAAYLRLGLSWSAGKGN
jgi:hypothetical protein